MAIEKKPDDTVDDGGKPASSSALGETTERSVSKSSPGRPSVRRTSAPSSLADGAERSTTKRPSTAKPLGASTEKSVSKRGSVRSIPPIAEPKAAPPEASNLDGSASPFALPKPPAGYRPDDAPDTTSSDVALRPKPAVPGETIPLPNIPLPNLPPPPKPPAGYKPDSLPEKTQAFEREAMLAANAAPDGGQPEKTAAFDLAEGKPVGGQPEKTAAFDLPEGGAAGASPSQPPRKSAPSSENRDGSTVLKHIDDIKPEPKPFAAPKPPAGYKPDVAQLKTTIKQSDAEETDRSAPLRVAEQRTNIKSIQDELALAAKTNRDASPGPARVADQKTNIGAAPEPPARVADQRTNIGPAPEPPVRVTEQKTNVVDLAAAIGVPASAAATTRPDPIDTLPAGTPGVKPPGPGEPGAFSRAQAAQAAQAAAEAKAAGGLESETRKPLTRDQRIAMGVVGSGLGLIVVALIASFGSFRDKPSANDMERCYPYGDSGALGPNGVKAPPAREVVFEVDQDLDSPVSRDYEKCLIVRYHGPGVNLTNPFVGSMVMCKRWDKMWQRGNDDGMPFRVNQ